MSFFKSQPKLQIGQRSIAYVSQNGLSFRPGQKIVVEIDDALEFFAPAQSYLKIDVKIDTQSPTFNYLCQIDSLIGAQALLSEVKILNRAGVLLEEYANYPSWVNINTLYTENETNINKKALMEGVVAHNPEQKSWNGSTPDRFTNSQYNPYFTKDANGNATYQTVTMCIKLDTGIMKSNKVFFNRLMGGIRFEFILNTASQVMKQIRSAVDTANDFTPKLSHINDKGKYTGFQTIDSPATSLFLSWDNNMMTDADRCPFCVGERIVIDGLPLEPRSITKIEMAEVGGENFIKLTIASMANAVGNIASGAFIASTSMEGNTQLPTFEVSDVAMIMEEIKIDDSYRNAMTKALQENGSVTYNCVCATNYRHSVLASDIESTVQLNLTNSMAKSILVVPTSKNNEAIKTNMIQFDGLRNGISGVWDNLTSYQWSYDSKLQPDRPVNTVKTQNQTVDIYDGQYLAEIEKALALGGIPPLSYEHIKKNAVIGRALALENQIYSTIGKDFQLNLSFGGTQDQAKLLNCWIVHLRRFVVTSSGVQVIH
mgnify:CR=1 FL=1